LSKLSDWHAPAKADLSFDAFMLGPAKSPKARGLLAGARRAVEVVIEESEAAGLDVTK
jgi:hypothetical protein